MSVTRVVQIWLLFAALLFSQGTASARQGVGAGFAWPGTATRGGVAPVRGHLVEVAEGGFAFEPEGGGEAIRLAELSGFRPDAGGVVGPALPSAFQAEIAGVGRISGGLVGIDETSLRMRLGGEGERAIPRGVVRSVVQGPGEALMLAEPFESLDQTAWVTTGSVEIGAGTVREGTGAVGLSATGATLERALGEPVTAGLFECLYWDDGATHGAAAWWLELRFRGNEGGGQLQVVPGWRDEFLAVRTDGGLPGLAIQALPRQEGWHKLVVRFGPDRIQVLVDEAELAYGGGTTAALVGLRFETRGDQAQPTPELTATIDDLRVLRRTGQLVPTDEDPSQDEVQRVGGDQLFGRLESADSKGARLRIWDEPVFLPWSEVAGIRFQRESVASRPLEGTWVRMSWDPGRSTAGAHEPDAVEGVLRGIGPDEVVVEAPWVGRLRIATGRVRELAGLGEGWRLVVDPASYHLGDGYTASLSPPRPDTGPLEMAFELEEIPGGRTDVTVEVVEAIGVEGDARFSERVRRGELVTHVALNGERFDQLNRHITQRNDRPMRIRLPIPEGLLVKGRNTLRFEQVGTAERPELRDNLGISRVAIEADSRGAGREARP